MPRAKRSQSTNTEFPHLILCAACQHVSSDTVDNGITLHRLFEGFDVGVMPGAPEAIEVQDGPAALPFKWTVFSLWKKRGRSTGKLEQVVDFVNPSGRVIATSVLAFEQKKTFHRNTVNFGAIPTEEGDYEVRVFIRRPKGRRKRCGSYPISIGRAEGNR